MIFVCVFPTRSFYSLSKTNDTRDAGLTMHRALIANESVTIIQIWKTTPNYPGDNSKSIIQSDALDCGFRFWQTIEQNYVYTNPLNSTVYPQMLMVQFTNTQSNLKPNPTSQYSRSWWLFWFWWNREVRSRWVLFVFRVVQESFVGPQAHLEQVNSLPKGPIPYSICSWKSLRVSQCVIATVT